MNIYIDGWLIATLILTLFGLGFIVFVFGYDYGYKTAKLRSKIKFWQDSWKEEE